MGAKPLKKYKPESKLLKPKLRVVKMNTVFQQLWLSKQRYFLLTGGRGSLKTTHVMYFISDLLAEAGHGVLFTRWTMTAAETSIIPEFRAIAKRLGREHLYKFTNTRVINKQTGSFIVFKGLKTASGKQTANLKGIAGITTWVIEEGEDFDDENMFTDIDLSIRGGEMQNRVIWIQNPSTKNHFIYKLWLEDTHKKVDYDGYDVSISTNKEVCHIHTTYHIAKEYLNKSILKKYKKWRKNATKLKNKYKSKYYQKIIGGWLEQAEGVIFQEWKERAFPTNLPTIAGMDYGYSPDPLALIEVAIEPSRKRIYLRELIYKTELSNKKLLDLIKKRTRTNLLIITDVNEPKTNAYLKKRGINCRKVKKRRIIERIKEYQDWEIIIDPDSHNLKKEFNEYAWNDDKSDTPIDKFNHGHDAWMYAADRYLKMTG